MNLIEKWKNGGGSCPPSPGLFDIFMGWLGGVLSIGAIGYVAHVTEYPLVLGSFGASCVLIFGFPESPFSQPRNVIGGHILASFIGLVFLFLLGSHWWSMAIAAGTAIAAMMCTKTVHPPAGSNPLIIMLSLPTWEFLLTPTLIGATMLVLVALFFNNLPRQRVYPRYWF